MEPPPLPPRSDEPPRSVVPLGYQTSGYAPSGPPVDGWRVFRQFVGGFLIGSAVSAVAWGLGWEIVDTNAGGVAIVVVPGVKLMLAIVFLCIRGKRGWGGGLLLSIAMGFLIFFVSCAAHLAK